MVIKRVGRKFHLRDLSLVVKLSATLLFAALIPMTLTAVYNLSGSLDRVLNTEQQSLKLLAASTAAQLDQLMTDNGYVVAQISGDNDVVAFLNSPPEQQSPLRRGVERTLQSALDSNPAYEYVYLMDAQGKTLVSRQIAGTPSVEGQSFEKRAYFKQAQAGQPYIDVLVGRTSKRLGFYFASPVKNGSGRILGVAVIKLKGEAITSVVSMFQVGETGYAFLVDQDGVIVSHPNKDWYYHSLGELSRTEQVKAGQRFVLDHCENPDDPACQVANLGLSTLAASMRSATAPDFADYISPLDGTKQIVGFAATQQLRWVVGVNRSWAEFTSPVTALAIRSLLSVGVVGVLVVLLALRLARGISRPIARLAEVAQEVEGDQVFDPTDIANIAGLGDEVGHLARVFSQMVVALRARMAELRTIYEVGNTITSSVELDETLRYILTSVHKIIPYHGAEIGVYHQGQGEMLSRSVCDTTATGQKPMMCASNDLNEGYRHWLFQTGVGLLVPDVTNFAEVEAIPDSVWQQIQPRSYLGVPLRANGEVIGAIQLLSRQPNGFSEDNLRILESIAIQASVAVQNATQVQIRESKLKHEIQELRIAIDEVKRAKQVEEIISSDSFQSIREKAQELRKRAKRNGASNS